MGWYALTLQRGPSDVSRRTSAQETRFQASITKPARAELRRPRHASDSSQDTRAVAGTQVTTPKHVQPIAPARAGLQQWTSGQGMLRQTFTGLFVESFVASHAQMSA